MTILSYLANLNAKHCLRLQFEASVCVRDFHLLPRVNEALVCFWSMAGRSFCWLSSFHAPFDVQDGIVAHGLGCSKEINGGFVFTSSKQQRLFIASSCAGQCLGACASSACNMLSCAATFLAPTTIKKTCPAGTKWPPCKQTKFALRSDWPFSAIGNRVTCRTGDPWPL